MLPKLARGLLRDTFERHHDLEVVDIPGGTSLSPTIEDACDVIVTTATRTADSLDGSLSGQLRRPSRNTLVVTIDGALIMIFEYRPRQQLIDPAPDALVAAIRDEVATMKRGEA